MGSVIPGYKQFYMLSTGPTNSSLLEIAKALGWCTQRTVLHSVHKDSSHKELGTEMKEPGLQ